MSQQILLISYVDSEVADIRNKLQAELLGSRIDTAVNMRQGFQRLAQKPTDLIVMNFDQITEVVGKHVRNLKSVVDRCPLLVLGKIEAGPLMNQLSSMYRTVILDKPYSDRDLTGLAQKILSARDVSQRIHRRFATSQMASIELYGKNVESETTLLNLSRGGAYMELPTTQDITIGDLMRLNVDLDQTRRNYRMHAKVVWTTHAGLSNGEYGVGVEFIRPGDVYREMQGR